MRLSSPWQCFSAWAAEVSVTSGSLTTACRPAGHADRGRIPGVRPARRAADHGLQPARRRAPHRQAHVHGVAHGRPVRYFTAGRDVQTAVLGPRLFEAVRKLGDIADGAGLPLPELSFRWLLSKPGVGSILLGGSKLEQLQANIAAAAKGPLPADIVAACDAVAAETRGPMPKYNR